MEAEAKKKDAKKKVEDIKETVESIAMNDQQQARIDKMNTLREMGIDPFGQGQDQTHHASEIFEQLGDKTIEDLDSANHTVSIAGRIMSKRRMGKLGFIHLLDRSGRIQVVINQRVVGDDIYNLFKMSDLGDIIGVKGRVIKTMAGELSVEVHEYTHLCKALRPLPEKYHGLTDKEERYRRRYLDLIMNDSSREVALLRPRIVSAIRHYMDSHGYVEVETPILSPILGGASARPFITPHNAWNKDFY